MNNVYSQAKQHLKLTKRMRISSLRKALIMSAIIGATLYIVLFSKTPAVHDYFHHLRHDLMIIPCH